MIVERESDSQVPSRGQNHKTCETADDVSVCGGTGLDGVCGRETEEGVGFPVADDKVFCPGLGAVEHEGEGVGVHGPVVAETFYP